MRETPPIIVQYLADLNAADQPLVRVIRFGRVVRPCFLLEGRRPILEELFLPAIEDRRPQARFLTQIRDWHFVQLNASQRKAEPFTL